MSCPLRVLLFYAGRKNLLHPGLSEKSVAGQAHVD